MCTAEAPLAPLGAYSTPACHASITNTYYRIECTTFRFSAVLLSQGL